MTRSRVWAGLWCLAGPGGDQKDADQVCWCQQSRPAPGPLSRVGGQDCGGVFCPGKHKQYRESNIREQIHFVDRGGEEEGFARGNATVWPQHLLHSEISDWILWFLHSRHVWCLVKWVLGTQDCLPCDCFLLLRFCCVSRASWKHTWKLQALDKGAWEGGTTYCHWHIRESDWGQIVGHWL